MQFSTLRLGGATSLLMLILLMGCTTTPDALIPPVGANPNPGEGPGEAPAAERELDVAKRMMQAREYSQAIPRLMHVTDKYPNSPAATESLYFLGTAYYQISGLKDARDHFVRYLAAAPAGEHAESSRQYLSTLQEREEEELLSTQAIDTRIAQVQSAAAGRELELPQRLELADLHWKKGDYAAAGKIYEQVLDEYPALANDSVLRTRMEKVSDDTYVLLTPGEVLRREAEAEPLVIFNTSSFRSGRFETLPATSRERFYTVTGQVANRSENTLQDVQIIVTIYGFGSMVYDTQTVTIGTLLPDQKRAFSARFNNFDNIENVNRYECVGTFRQ